MVPDLIVLALDYFRTPLRYPHLADPEQPLPKGFDNLVSDFGIALAPRNIGATGRALGARPEEVERASRFFLRQVLLSPRSNHYRVLGASPTASDEAIRRNYRLLIRIFHPDRSVGDAERDAAHTARINEAYNVLKNPVARQRYDRQLASSSLQGETKASPQPLSSTAPLRFSALRSRRGAGLPVLGGRLTVLLVWGGIAVVLVAALAILLSNRQPFLRANPDLADASTAKPSYLRESPPRPTGQAGIQVPLLLPGDVVVDVEGSKLPPVGSSAKTVLPVGVSSPYFTGVDLQKEEEIGQGDPSLAKEQGLTQSVLSSVRNSNEATMATPTKALLEDLIVRLTSYYRAGDLHGLVDLFTADARVNDGSGKDFIRAEYADFFAKVPERRLSISNLSWQSMSKGKLIGWGEYQVRIRDSRDAGWRSSSGALLIELVPGASGFMISELILR